MAVARSSSFTPPKLIPTTVVRPYNEPLAMASTLASFRSQSSSGGYVPHLYPGAAIPSNRGSRECSRATSPIAQRGGQCLFSGFALGERSSSVPPPIATVLFSGYQTPVQLQGQPHWGSLTLGLGGGSYSAAAPVTRGGSLSMGIASADSISPCMSRTHVSSAHVVKPTYSTPTLASAKSSTTVTPVSVRPPISVPPIPMEAVHLGEHSSEGTAKPVTTNVLSRDELEALRERVAVQEELIESLRKELQTVRQNETRCRAEAEVARAQADRLIEELRLERLARQTAEALVFEQHAAADLAVRAAHTSDGQLPDGQPPVDLGASSAVVSSRVERSKSPTQRAPRATGAAKPAAQERVVIERQSSTNGAARKAPPSKRPAAAGSADPIDDQLQSYLSQNNIPLVFKRLNRGFYNCYRQGENPGDVHNVEVSSNGGKLLVQLETRSQGRGWNNNKAGAIERFVTFMLS